MLIEPGGEAHALFVVRSKAGFVAEHLVPGSVVLGSSQKCFFISRRQDAIVENHFPRGTSPHFT